MKVGVQCSHCDKDGVASVFCEGCGGNYCRKPCWRFHWCNVLTDHEGREVKVGDIVFYRDNPLRIYTITETPMPFVKVGVCYGERLERRNKTDTKTIIRPRLMKLKIKE